MYAMVLIREKYKPPSFEKNVELCSSRKYPYSTTEGIGITWGSGTQKTKFKKKYEAFLKFPDGLAWKGVNIFWNYT